MGDQTTGGPKGSESRDGGNGREQDYARYLCVKVSWKGKYKRIIGLTATSLRTLDPSDLSVTNSWTFTEDIVGISLEGEDVIALQTKQTAGGPALSLVKSGGGTKLQKFQTGQRAALLADLHLLMRVQAPQVVRTLFPEPVMLQCARLRSRGRWQMPSALRLTATTVERTEPHTGLVAWSLPIRNIMRVEVLTDADAPFSAVFAFIPITGDRPKVFSLEEWKEFVAALTRLSCKNAGAPVEILDTTANGACSLRNPRLLSDSWIQEARAMAGHAEAGPTSPTGGAGILLAQYEVIRVKGAPGLVVGGAALGGALSESSATIAASPGKRLGRSLAVFSSSFVERREETFEILSQRQLSAITAIVRSEEEPQLVTIELGNNEVPLSYILSQRDDLIAAVVGAAEEVQRRPVPIIPAATSPGKRLSRDPGWEEDDLRLDGLCVRHLTASAKEVMSSLMSAAANSASTRHAIALFMDRISEFNATVPYGGLTPNSLVPEALLPALLSLLPSPPSPKAPKPPAPNVATALQFIGVLQCFRRLVGANAGSPALTGAPGAVRKIFAALDCGNEAVAFEATRLMAAMCRGERGPPPVHEKSGLQEVLFGQSAEMKAAAEEQAIRSAKRELLAGSNRLSFIMSKLREGQRLSPLVSVAIMDLVDGIACDPHRKTTEEALFHDMLRDTVAVGRPLFSLFQHPVRRVRSTTARLMRVVAEHGAKAAAPMREAAMREGALLVHLHQALFSDSSSARKLSQELVALWCDGYQPAMELLARVFPAGLVVVLRLPKGARVGETAERRANSADKKDDSGNQDALAAQDAQAMAAAAAHGHHHGHHKKAVSWVVSRLKLNWTSFWSELGKNHKRYDVVWNELTRQELRNALEESIELLRTTRKSLDAAAGGQDFSWNYLEFSISYSSLEQMLSGCGVYVTALLENIHKGKKVFLRHPERLYNIMWHRFLEAGDTASLSPLKDVDLTSEAQNVRELCIRTMTAVYSLNHKDIGNVSGVAHIMKLIDYSTDNRQRHLFLQLLDVLADNQANAAEMLARGAAEILLQLAGMAHATSKVFEKHNNEDGTETSAKEWYFKRVAPIGSGKEDKVVGPISKAQIILAHENGDLDMKSICRAEGMSHWMSLYDFRELRWMLSSKSNIMNPFEVAIMAVSILRKMAAFHSAVDASGDLTVPLPRVHRELTSDRNLPHVVQLLLIESPEVVANVARLLETIIQHNAVVRERFYLTGVYFFALAYSGSNLLEVSSLLLRTHRKQQTFGSVAGLRGAASRPSILSGILPESMLFVLDKYGAEEFAKSLVADVDSPELIWTHHMRTEALIPLLRLHIRTFARRLQQNNHLVYDFCPLPPIKYASLKEEVWCHRYYLRNFCNSVKFPEMDVVDHVEFLQGLLSQWKGELTRQDDKMTTEQALSALGIEANIADLNESTIRKAFRVMAMKYHPDKNPAGRERFIVVQAAYERLQAGTDESASGPQVWRLELLLKAQCILYRKYPSILGEYKYGGYAMLLGALSLDNTSGLSFLEGKGANIIVLAAELAWLTCVASQTNGDELIRSGALSVLSSLFARIQPAILPDMSSDSAASQIAMYLLRLFSGIATTDLGSRFIFENPGLMVNIRQCCLLETATKCINSALQCVSNMATKTVLRTMLIRGGFLFDLIPIILEYDPTFESLQDSGANQGKVRERVDSAAEKGDGGARNHSVSNSGFMHRQEKNYMAMLAVRALGRLAGTLDAEKLNMTADEDAVAILEAILTLGLASQLSAKDPRAFLTDITSSVETSRLIWNEEMRTELLSFVAKQSEIREANEGHVLQVTDLNAAKEFRFKELNGELVVGDVYIRIFNSNPTVASIDEVDLTYALLTYMKGKVESIVDCQKDIVNGDRMLSFDPKLREHLMEALDALHILLQKSPNLASLLANEELLAGLQSVIRPGTLSSAEGEADSRDGLEEEDKWRAAVGDKGPILCEKVIAVLTVTLSHAICHEILSDRSSASRMLRVLWQPPLDRAESIRDKALVLISALAHTDGYAKAAAFGGGVIFLLSMLLPDETAPRVAGHVLTFKQKTAVVHILEKLSMQKMHGPQVLHVLRKIVQEGFVSLLHRGDNQAFVSALDEECVCPERIWSPDMRKSLAAKVEDLSVSAFFEGSASLCSNFSIPEDWVFECAALKEHQEFGGVYLDLYVKDPNFPLSYPKKFAEAMLSKYMELLGEENTSDETSRLALQISSGLIQLVVANPMMIEHVVSLGYVKNLVGHITIKSPQAAHQTGPDLHIELQGSSLRILHQLMSSASGAQALAACTDPYAVPAIMAAMEWGMAGCILSLETLKRSLVITNRSRDVIVAQCLTGGLVQNLVKSLEWEQSDTNPSGSSSLMLLEDSAGSEKAAQRVMAIEVLKLLSYEGKYSAKVNAYLEGCPAWMHYKDQKLDMFLPSGSTQSSTGVVGALTGGSLQQFALPAPDST